MGRPATVLGALLLCACGVSQWAFVSSPLTGGGALLYLRFSDSPVDGAERVWIAIERVEALGPGGPRTLLDGRREYDLLTLQNGNDVVLFAGAVPAGAYQGLRLTLARESAGRNRIEVAGEVHPLAYAWPEGEVVQILRPFTLAAEEEATIHVDFNVRTSVLEAGGVWMLDPRLDMLRPADAGHVGGLVTGTSGQPVSGATASAQQGGVEVRSARSLADGRYRLGPLEAGIYEVVITAQGHAPHLIPQVFVAQGRDTLGVDASLAGAQPGSLGGLAAAGPPGLVVRAYAGAALVALAGVDPLTGSYRFPAVPAGAYVVELWSPDALLARRTGIQVVAGLPTLVDLVP